MRSRLSIPPTTMDSEDPLTLAAAPPKHETNQQRVQREQQDIKARKTSEDIDAQIRADKLALKKKKKVVKVLLLGQSESGKSTTIKNFQIAYAYKAWAEERASWRAVIQLNLVRSVNTILDVLTKEMSQPTSPTSPRSMHMPGTVSTDTLQFLNDDSDISDPSTSSSASSTRRYIPRTPSSSQLRPRFAFSEEHKILKLRLQPLRRIQKDLELRLGAGASEPTDCMTSPSYATPFSEYEPIPNVLGDVQPNPHRPREFSVRSNTGWKAALDKVRPRLSLNTRLDENENEEEETRQRKRSMKRARRVDDEATDVIAECAEDIKTLWTDEVVRTLLAKRKMRLEDAPGFFLNDVERIATREYVPSDDDVVRARLRTMGVQEHSLKFERGSEQGREWVIYDVGGSRSCRSAWYPYFDDINAIIFVAPISCFDESLAEDRRVNRLDDSLLLWKSLCSSPLLTNVQLVLFLNKFDLLERKLSKDGGVVRVKDYVPGYGDRTNNADTVAGFFRQKFGSLSKQYSPEPRGFYAFVTSVTDTKATKLTLDTVREGILRKHLKQADLLP